MIKGLFLSLSISVFIVSLILFVFGTTGNLQENFMTGNVIGISNIEDYSFIGMFLSMISFIMILSSGNSSYEVKKARRSNARTLAKLAFLPFYVSGKLTGMGLRSLGSLTKGGYNAFWSTHDALNSVVDPGIKLGIKADEYRKIQESQGDSPVPDLPPRNGFERLMNFGPIKTFANNYRDAAQQAELERISSAYKERGLDVSPELAYQLRKIEAERLGDELG